MRWCHGAAALFPIIVVAALVTLYLVWDVEMNGNAGIADFEMLPLVIDDPPVLFDMLDFHYLLEPEPCSDEPLLSTLLVTSHYEHVEMRSVLRRGYTRDILKAIGFRMIFLLGKPTSASNSSEEPRWQQGAIQDESKRFGDILQGNFLEAYRNLTYKNSMGLLWAASKCSSATYIAKMDDDVAVNLFELVKVMRKQTGKRYQLTGSVISRGQVRRTLGDKWRLTKEEFAGDVYPTYLSGWLYFGPTELLGRIALHATKLPYIFIDDAFLLGIVRENLFGSKVTFHDFYTKFTYNYADVICCIAKPKVDCMLIAGPSDYDVALMARFIRRAVMCAIPGRCLPAKESKHSCKTDARKFFDSLVLSQVENNNGSIDGVISPVPL